MRSRNLEDAWRLAMARRTTTKAALAAACLPYLVDSSFRAQPARKAVDMQADDNRPGEVA